MKVVRFSSATALWLSIILVGLGAGTLSCRRPAKPKTTKPVCSAPMDAGDDAWSKEAIQALLGRMPNGVREVKLISQLVAQAGRPAAARVIMDDPAFIPRWTDFLIDQARVGRTGQMVARDCYKTPLRSAPSSALAAFLRDNPPTATAPGGDFNMADVLQSSLALDDLSPYYLAELFARMSRPVPPCKNVSDIENDTGRRRNFSNTFEETYLHRSNDCSACHNADFSPTASSDPAANRFWPLPGHYEQALWGASAGRDPNQTQVAFRSIGVVRPPSRLVPLVNDEVVPWGMNQACGVFHPAGSFGPDPAGFTGFLGGALNATASIWELEQELATGFSAVTGKDLPADPLDGPRAMAGLVAQTIAHDVWTEVIGSPLTMAHHFPRNEAQRDVLSELSTAFLRSKFSLRTLLVEIVTTPTFNIDAPANRPDDAAYPCQPIFNPASVDATAADERGNGTGDRVHRAPARAILRSVSTAMGWSGARDFPMPGEAAFQESLGAPLNESQTGQASADFQGLLAWEDRYGACVQPSLALDTAVDDVPTESTSGSCAGNCGVTGVGVGNTASCSCDDTCTDLGDCCSDYDAACPLPSVSSDWLDTLGQVADAWNTAHPTEPLTIRDVVLAEKDHLIVEPTTRADEEPLTAPLFGAASLDAPLPASAQWLPAARTYCGVLLKTPQFLMRGLPAVATGSLPRLVVPSSETVSLCTSMSAAIQKELGRAPICQPTGVSFAP